MPAQSAQVVATIASLLQPIREAVADMSVLDFASGLIRLSRKDARSPTFATEALVPLRNLSRVRPSPAFPPPVAACRTPV